MKAKMFEVVEYASYYAVRHVATGKEHAMSDGVDVLPELKRKRCPTCLHHTLYEETGRMMTPGTEKFRLQWERFLNEDQYDTLEAYFPELYYAAQKEEG